MFFYYILTVARKMMQQHALLKKTHLRIKGNHQQIRYLVQQNTQLDQQQLEYLAELERLQKLMLSYV